MEMVDAKLEKIVEMVADLVTRRGITGRRIYSQSAKQALVELCARPGVSVAGLALQHGLNANLLRRWVVKYGGPQSPTATPACLPAKLLAVKTRAERSPGARVSLKSYVEIRYAGARIRVQGTVDARVLGIVLDCLAQRA